MRFAPTLLVLVLAACRAAPDAQASGQLRYKGHSLEEWWMLRRDPDDVTAADARVAIRTMGAEAVPFLANKAASHDLGDNIGGSVALESLCPTALPAMKAARREYPSPALDVAIRRVEASAATRGRSELCVKGGTPVGPEGER